MKVIFLDFNGVLDTYDDFDIINEDNLKRLKKIVLLSGASVVISSSCKNNYFYNNGKHGYIYKMLVERLQNEGISVVGFTKLMNSRQEEIKNYLSTHIDINSYCILDDDYDMEDLSEHIVKLPNQMSSCGMGLQDEDVVKALNILGVELKEQVSQSILRLTLKDN